MVEKAGTVKEKTFSSYAWIKICFRRNPGKLFSVAEPPSPAKPKISKDETRDRKTPFVYPGTANRILSWASQR